MQASSPREHNVIAWLKMSQSAVRIPFWDTDIQICETGVQALLPLFPSPPLYSWKPQESFLLQAILCDKYEDGWKYVIV